MMQKTAPRNTRKAQLKKQDKSAEAWMLFVSRCVGGHLSFYPISLTFSGDFGTVITIVLAVTFRVIVFTFWYFNFEFFY